METHSCFPLLQQSRLGQTASKKKTKETGCFLREKWIQAFSSLEHEYAQATPIASVQRLVLLESLHEIRIHE